MCTDKRHKACTANFDRSKIQSERRQAEGHNTAFINAGSHDCSKPVSGSLSMESIGTWSGPVPIGVLRYFITSKRNITETENNQIGLRERIDIFGLIFAAILCAKERVNTVPLLKVRFSLSKCAESRWDILKCSQNSMPRNTRI
jgi:hypothetical protein